MRARRAINRSQDAAPAGYSLLSRITAQLVHPAIRTALTAQSEYNRLKYLNARPDTRFAEPYGGQPIVLAALYEKGELRPDIVRLLKTSKSFGYYVIGVNTLRISNPDNVRDVFDCYIERVNYGRDFGSYKDGFLKVYSQGMDRTCPRLLMLNDSVFYSEERVEPFLREMMNSEIEVLGSTENYEINYHLGSFCISMAGSVLRHPKFRRYWISYRLSDVRPVVIKRGEMGLSKVLKRCASSEKQFRALYDSTRFSEYLRAGDDDLLDEIVALTRRGDVTPARRFLLKEQMEKIEDDFLFKGTEYEEVRVAGATLEEVRRNSTLLGSYSEMKTALEDQLLRKRDADLAWLRETVEARLVDNFRQHSQIHQNAAILLHMGLPIVKLDLLYRGMSNIVDVNTICRMLNKTEARELRLLLLSRPFGGDTLFGWRRAAFMNGLI